MIPFAIATGTMSCAQNIFIRIHTDEGITGVGECSAFPVITGETQATCFEVAKDFAAIWKGKYPLNIEERLNELHECIYGNYTIKSAFDMALYDIAAKRANQPLYKFLGGNLPAGQVNKKIIESDLTIGIGTPGTMAATAVEFKQKGVKIIKVKLGKKPDEDVERIKRIRAAVGDEIILRVDANQGWSYEDAEFVLQNIQSYNIQFCEQPMRKYHDDLLLQLRMQTIIPIMADESVFTHYDAERIIKNNATDYINIKFAKSGGINEALRINTVAAKNSIACMMGGMLESRLALTAKVHFALANDNIKFYDLDTCLLGHLEDPVTGGATFKGMNLEIGDSIGIGADVDDAFLKKLEKVVV